MFKQIKQLFIRMFKRDILIKSFRFSPSESALDLYNALMISMYDIPRRLILNVYDNKNIIIIEYIGTSEKCRCEKIYELFNLNTGKYSNRIYSIELKKYVNINTYIDFSYCHNKKNRVNLLMIASLLFDNRKKIQNAIDKQNNNQLL